MVVSKREKMSLPRELKYPPQYDFYFNNEEYHDNFWTTKNQAFKNGNFATEQDFCEENFANYHCHHCGYAYIMQNVKPCETYVGPLEKQCCVSFCSPSVNHGSIIVDITTSETVCSEPINKRLAAILVPLLSVIGRGMSDTNLSVVLPRLCSVRFFSS